MKPRSLSLQRSKSIDQVMVPPLVHRLTRLCACRLKESGIGVSDGRVVFGQLLGMCDHVTFPLGELACEISDISTYIVSTSIVLVLLIWSCF